MTEKDHYADILAAATTHAECYSAGLRVAKQAADSKLERLLQRLEHVVALWDADDPCAAYAALVQSIAAAREGM